jgi:predicted flap endonuclease-1-like 5' DNA nuclease/uncharacterized protein YoxC
MTDQTLINYFTQIDSREGLFLWMCMLIAFLIGFIIAYLLRSGKVRRLKKELSEARQQLETNQTLLTSAQDQLKQRNAELQEESREKVDLMERLRIIEQEKDQQLHDVVALNQRLEEIQATNRTYSHTIDDLNSQIVSLKTQNEQLLEHPQNFADTPAPTTSAPSREVAELRERLNAFETSLSRLSGENQTLRSDLAILKSQPVANTIVDTAVEAEDGELVLGNDKTVIYDKIIVSDRDKDALTAIEGIGEFLEKKLNSIGVFSYEDIANWTPGRIDEVTTQIGYIPGRIEKDDWVGQAALLLQKEQEAPAPKAFAEASGLDKKATDLKIIEGIGPKIEEVLKDAGIGDWSALAATEPGRLKEILEEAGDQYRMHNPYTWPLQARLAAAGRWEEFNTYQEELKGGRE